MSARSTRQLVEILAGGLGGKARVTFQVVEVLCNKAPMTLRTPLVIVAGQVQQLQSTEALDTINDYTATNDNAGSIVIGAPVYLKTNGNVDKARANAIATTVVFGLVKDTLIAAAASGRIQIGGVLAATTGQWDAVTGQTGGLTAGSDYYLDPATAGKLTTTIPTTATQFVEPVGTALSTVEMRIRPQQPIKL